MQNEYKDVEQLLYKGLLTSPVNLFDSHIILKSVNKNELDLIETICEDREDKRYKYRYNSYYGAMSILYIDGLNTLAKRRDNLPMLYNYLYRSPSQVYYALFSGFYELSSRYINAYNLLTEKYLYTDQSRYNWRILKNKEFFKSCYTGIDGTDILGFNDLQRYWISFNESEDSQYQDEQKYSLSAFIGASINNPKAVQQFLQNLDKNKEEEGVRRSRKLEGIKEKDDNEYRLSKRVETWEDLVEELEKQIDGKDKDIHDLAIEQHENKVKELYINQLKEIEKLKIKADQNVDELIEDNDKQIGLTEEEVIRQIKNNKRSRKSVPVLDIEESEMERNIGRMTNPIKIDELKDIATKRAGEEVKDNKKNEKNINKNKIKKLKEINEEDSI